MRKNIWILNHYASGMFFDNGGRHYSFAKYLKAAGYRVTVFCCNAKHGGNCSFLEMNGLWKEKINQEICVPFVFVQGRNYAQNGKQRVLNMVDFYRNVQKAGKEYARANGAPDVIFASSVHPLTLVAGERLAKHFKIPCICEVRDLWPEAIVAYSKKLTKRSPIARALYAGERWIYKKADAVVFTQEGGPDYLREQGWAREQGGPLDMGRMFYINNGVDLEVFDRNRQENPYPDPDLDDPDTYKVVYAGSIRRVNDLGTVLDAAKCIKDPRIRFLIFGDGDELETLKERTAQEHISNVIFKGRVEKRFVPSVVSKADLNLAHWEMTPLLRVGESCNKSFEYFAAAKPTFQTVRPGYSLVEKHQCGRLTEDFAPQTMARGIEEMAAMSPEETQRMSENARQAAQLYDFKELTRQLISIIETR